MLRYRFSLGPHIRSDFAKYLRVKKTRAGAMIVLHEPKLIFLKARKVAGTSLEIALSKYASASSVITPVGQEDELIRESLGFRGPQRHMYSIQERLRFPIKEVLPALFKRSRRRKYTQHMSAAEVRSRVGDEVWSTYTKVSVIRAPLDYFISYYCWQNRGVPDGERPIFCDWCYANIDIYALNNEQYFIEGYLAVDRFLRFERLSEDLSKLEVDHPELAGLSATFGGIRAKGGARKTSDTEGAWFKACPSVAELIYDRYADIIDGFGMDLPSLRHMD